MSNLPTLDVEIHGSTYRIAALPAKPARQLWFRLLKVIGPGVSAYLTGASAGDEGKVAGAALTEVLSGLSEELFDHIVSTFAKQTTVVYPDGNHARLDLIIDKSAFAQDMTGLLTWLRTCLEHQYGDFLALLGLTPAQR